MFLWFWFWLLTGPFWGTLTVVGVDSVHAGSSVGALMFGAVVDVVLTVGSIETCRQPDTDCVFDSRKVHTGGTSEAAGNLQRLTWEAVAGVAGFGGLVAGAPVQTRGRRARDVGAFAESARESGFTDAPAAEAELVCSGRGASGLVRSLVLTCRSREC